MFFQNNHIRKITSVGLLIILLFIHSVKLLHAHLYISSGSNAGSDETAIVKKCNTENSFQGNDCDICSYQLSKDADDLVYPVFLTEAGIHGNLNTYFHSSHTISFPSAFEGRGPPAIM
jgi:hypothetical protein